MFCVALRARCAPWRTLQRRCAAHLLSEERHTDTIVQLSSGHARAGVAVIRISGPRAHNALCKLASGAPSTLPVFKPRVATLCRLHHPHTNELLESQALSLYFPAPRSFTGEECVELHVHGAPVLVADVLGALISLPETRLANAGEFTRRAFMHGKMDLTQVEGLADLLDAETQQQRRQAQRQMDGELGKLYEAWRTELAQCLAHIEAVIDFSDTEADVGEHEIVNTALPRLAAFAAKLSKYLSDGRRGELMRRGLSVAICGAPNAGKSSLLNRLARRPVAIVSSRPGTTRDVLEVSLNINGLPLVLADTAGLRESDDEIEREGVRRATLKLESADLKLAVFDVSRWPSEPLDATTVRLVDEHTLAVFNKSDQLTSGGGGGGVEDDDARLARILNSLPCKPSAAALVSCATEAGFERFLDQLGAEAKSRLGGSSGTAASEEPLITRARHRAHLQQCAQHLDECMQRLRDGDATTLVLAAEELRHAVRALGCVTGRVLVEDLLDIVFRDFCIGK